MEDIKLQIELLESELSSEKISRDYYSNFIQQEKCQKDKWHFIITKNIQPNVRYSQTK